MTTANDSRTTEPGNFYPWPNGFGLQLKLTLAFVLVSMVGFVVAFQMMPRLILKAWKQKQEEALDPNAQALRNVYFAMLEDHQSQREAVHRIAKELSQSEGFDLRGIEIPNRPMSARTFLMFLSQEKSPEEIEEIEKWLGFLDNRYGMLLVIPYRVESLAEKTYFFYRRTQSGDQVTEEYYLPFMAPLSAPDRGFEGVLAAGALRSDQVQIQPDDVSSLLKDVDLSVADVNNVRFLPADLIEEWNPALYRKALSEKENSYWVEWVEGNDLIYQWMPVLDISKSPSEEGRLLGLFYISYDPPEGVFEWTELTSGAGYVAIAIAAVFALVFSYFFARGITRPIQTLTASATAFAEGKLDESVVVKSRDEIGILTKTFNEMRQRLQNTLQELQDRAETIELQKEELAEQFKALQVLQNYTENVLSSVDSAIFSVDLDGRVRSPNRAAQNLLGLEEGEMIESLMTEPLMERLRSAVEEGETTLSEEMTVVSPNQESVPVAVSVTPLREGEKVIGAVAVLTDLSVIKNLEATLSRQERLAALGQLTAGVAHEIRNPLSIIKACAEILQQNFQGQPGENGLCEDIIQEADRLSRVVTEFLTFARPSEPNIQPIQLNEVLEQTLDRIERTHLSGVRVRREFGRDLPEVEADPDQMEQVILNLVRNGVESMEEKGTLTVRSGYSESEKTVWFEIQDEGSGMDEETCRRVFDPFFTSKAEGTGLGLSICYRILESHRGGIEIRESRPNSGTTFRITLPVHEHEPA